MDSTYDERARRRREQLVGGVAKNHDELDALDWAFWRGASPSARLNAVWQLAFDAMAMHSENDAPPGFQGPAFGIRRRTG